VVTELAVLGIDVTSVANVEQFLTLIDLGDTDNELVRAVVDWPTSTPRPTPAAWLRC
jgi:hypothetical protein